ncbi:MAG: hypothetical protein U0637_10130 [Phycisphaerales bacterium]
MKMLRSLAIAAAAATVLSLGACHSTQKSAAAPGVMNSKCPFSGEAVDGNITCDYQGGKVAFCCAGCKGKWEKASDQARADMMKKAK